MRSPIPRFSRENRQRYRDKVKLCLDVFARMLAESRFDPDRRSIGLEIELNLTEETGDPALANTHVLELIADDDFQTELAQFNIEINIPPRKLEGAVFAELEETVRRDLNHAEEQAQKAHAHMMIIGILPTLTEQLLNGEALSANPRYKLLNEQIFAARGEDLEINISGVERLAMLRRHDRARGRVHERAAAPAGRSRGVRRALERRAGDRGRPAGDRRQLAVLLRARAVARDADRAVRADDRHAAGGAQGPGRAPARVVRRALDHVDLRPLRGERPLLPGAAAGGRGRGPDGGARARRRAAAAGAAAAQRHDLPLEPPDLRHLPRAPAPARREPRAAGRADDRRHARQRRLLLRARARAGRGRPAGVDADVVLGGARRTSTRARATGIDARVYWPGVGEAPATELVLRRLLPMAREGLVALGRRRAPTPTACWRSSSAAASSSVNGASWQAATFHRLYDRLDRADALREMTVRYREHMHSNEPVHTWPLPPKSRFQRRG